MTKHFTQWKGPDGIEQFIINQTGCKPYWGSGINIRIKNNTTILKSVENTYYYNDDLSDINNVKYTLFGNSGDQDENELRFNEPLLNRNKTKHIYLYHVKNSSKNKKWIWYGKYDIDKKETKRYIGKDNQMRNIIILSLKKIH